MKQSRFSVSASRAVFLATTLLLAACSSDDDPTGPGGEAGPSNGTMTATVDGGAWTAVQVTIVRTGGFISIGSSDTSGVGIGMAFQESGTGTYAIGAGATSATLTSGPNVWTASGTVGSGSVVVTSLDATAISGTFSFVLDQTVGSGGPAQRTVTNGAFTIQF